MGEPQCRACKRDFSDHGTNGQCPSTSYFVSSGQSAVFMKDHQPPREIRELLDGVRDQAVTWLAENTLNIQAARALVSRANFEQLRADTINGYINPDGSYKEEEPEE